MEKHHSCLNTRAIIEYFQDHLPDQVPGLFAGLGPELGVPAPCQDFLLEINNWVTSEVVIRMFQNARRLSGNDRVAFEIGFHAATRKKLGYVQRIIMFAHKNPRYTLRKAQQINDKFNKNKRLELVETTWDSAVLRLHWFPQIPGSLDFCLYNQGIYSGLPTIWNLPPGLVEETQCYFKGGECCEYRFKWLRTSFWRGTFLRLLAPWSILKSTIAELEQDKDLLRRKFAEVHALNVQLQKNIGELTRAQENGVALYRRLQGSERKYRGLVDHAHEGICLIDAEGVIRFANPRMKEITGYRQPEGLKMSDFCDQKNRQLLDKALARNRHGEATQDELELTSFKRGPVSVIMSSAPLTEENRFQGVLAMFSDISEKKKMEQQLLQQQKMEALGTLAGGLAHNFNNILMNIMGLSGLLLAGVSPGEAAYDDLKQIEQEVIKGSDLTKQLLSLGHRGPFAPQPLDLNEVVEKTAQLFGRTRREIALSQSLAPDLPPVEVDRGQLEQVLMNLLVNAWQAMAGKGEITLTSREVALNEDFCQPYGRPPGLYVHLALTDSGMGMDSRTLARIFEPFFTTKGVGRGTGLGLATVYAIIKNHRGIIRVESETGRGTTFHIYLPVSHQEAVTETGGVSQYITGSGTVLLVDDEESIIGVGKRMLEWLGYQVLTAANGYQALSLYQAHPDRIRLVILDMIMPGMGGLETYRRLKEGHPEVKVLVSSGYSLDGEAQKILDEGAQGFIQKPYRLEALSRKAAEILGPKARREAPRLRVLPPGSQEGS
jgi:PAS domain S-box-containing protein